MTSHSSVGRRDFLKLAASGSVAAGAVVPASAQISPAPSAAANATSAPSLEAHEVDPMPATQVVGDRVGSDYMVDVIKALGIEYIASNCGSSFRSLQESVTTYGGNRAPEFLLCTHEEASVAMGHGYAKIENKPIGVFLHNNVGIQHASMAIFNAYCDRAPVVMFAGNTLDATRRRGGAEWYHSDTDVAAMVRGFVKWDDQPVSLGHFSESTVRAYRVAMTAPMGPTLITVDKDLQEHASARGEEPAIPGAPRITYPVADQGAINELAEALVRAEAPVLIADRMARTQAGVDALVELAELIQAPVVNYSGSRLNFPQLHPLCQNLSANEVTRRADLVIGLETADFWSSVYSFREGGEARRIAPDNAKLMTLGLSDFHMRAGNQAFQRFVDVDLNVTADAQASLPALTEAVRRRMTGARRNAARQRGAQLAEAKRTRMDRFWQDAGYAWDASPISTARLSYEVWLAVRDKDWSLAHSPRSFTDFWDKRFTYHDLGRSGGSGVGYAAPAAVGAALANRKYGRFTVTIQPDGDLMYSPGVLWTAAHHRIPLLFVMHNNRAYHQEVMHLQRMACEHNRGMDTCTIGTLLDNPHINFSKLAQSMGVYAEGPIADPADLPAALARAVAVVERGEPALLDVVTQPR